MVIWKMLLCGGIFRMNDWDIQNLNRKVKILEEEVDFIKKVLVHSKLVNYYEEYMKMKNTYEKEFLGCWKQNESEE